MKFINNNNDIDLGMINGIYDLEIRYDPEDEDIATIGSDDTVSKIGITDNIYELKKLKERTINNNWVRCEIKM